MSLPNVLDVRKQMPPGRRDLSTARGLGLFLVLMTGYLVSLLATASVPWWPVQLLGFVPIFFFMCWLEFLGHDAGHGSLTRSRALNECLGRLSFLPALVPYTGWVVSHNKLHHAFTNVKGLDPMWAPLSKAEFDRLPRWRQCLERCYRTIPGVTLHYLVVLWWQSMMMPSPEAWARTRRPLVAHLDRLAVVGMLVLQVSGVIIWRGWLESLSWPLTPWPVALAACVLLPFLTMSWFAGMVGFLHHTHPRVRWYADRREWSFFRGQVEATVHVVTPWPVSWLMGHSLEHTAHHADPAVPLTALPESQQSLERAFPEVVMHEVTLASCLDVLAKCQLYDFQRHRWLDFGGRPTSGVDISGTPV
jgi:omega-6 fatty acid desaturase (delta-12 desaturase)